MSAAGVDASGVTEGKEVSLARGVEEVFERINGSWFDSESSTGKLERRAVKSRVDGLVSMVKVLKIDDIKLRARLAARDEELKELEKELLIERQRLNYVDSENKLLNKFLEENYALMDEGAKDRYIAERRARQAEAEARQAEADNAELDETIGLLSLSKYKSHNTVKLLGAITPGGAAVFSSDAYPGRVTDDKLTRACGFVGTMGPGEAAAADKGFLSSKPLFAAEGKELRMPAVIPSKVRSYFNNIIN